MSIKRNVCWLPIGLGSLCGCLLPNFNGRAHTFFTLISGRCCWLSVKAEGGVLWAVCIWGPLTVRKLSGSLCPGEVLCLICEDLLRLSLLSFSMRPWKKGQPRNLAVCFPILHRAQNGTKFGSNLTSHSPMNSAVQRSSHRQEEAGRWQPHDNNADTVSRRGTVRGL